MESSHLKAEVFSVFEELADAVRTLDLDRYFSFFDQSSFTSLNSDGTVYHDFTEFETAFRSQMPGIEKYLRLEFDNVKTTLLNSETAVLVNEYSAELRLKTRATIKAAGAGTQVWSKSSGNWLLVNVSSSTKSKP